MTEAACGVDGCPGRVHINQAAASTANGQPLKHHMTCGVCGANQYVMADASNERPDVTSRPCPADDCDGGSLGLTAIGPAGADYTIPAWDCDKCDRVWFPHPDGTLHLVPAEGAAP